MSGPREQVAQSYYEEGLVAAVQEGIRQAYLGLTTRPGLVGLYYLVYWRIRYGVPFRAGARCALSRNWMRGERPIVHDLLGRLRSDDVFYDVGAHIGLYTAIVASVLPAGQVVSFEPYEEFADELDRNLDELDSSATVVRAGIGPVDTEQAYDPVHRTASGSGGEGGGSENEPTIDETNVDARIEAGELPQPTVVKIDVAGAEHRVLQGIDGALTDSACRLVYCEIHPPARHRPSVTDFGGSVDAVFDYFLERGYEVEILSTPRPSELFIRAERP